MHSIIKRLALAACAAALGTSVGLLGTESASAQTQLQFGGDTTAQPSYPNAFTLVSPFQAFHFRVRKSGTYQFDTTTAGLSDTFASLFRGNFDPSKPNDNRIAFNDDFGSLSSRINQALVAGEQLAFVTNGFCCNQQGTYLFSLIGPGAIVLSDAEVATAALQSGQDTTRSFLDILNGQTWLAQTGGSSAGRVAAGQMNLGGIVPAMSLGMKDDVRPPARSQAHVWAAVLGGDHRIDGDDRFGPSSYHNRNWGVAFGLDAPVSPGIVVGLAGAAGQSDYKVDDISGKGDATNFRFALYGGWASSAAYANASLGYGRDEVDTERSFEFAPITGSTSIDEVLSAVEIGFRMPISGVVAVNPFANFKFGRQFLDSFEENVAGSGGLALAISGRDDTWGRSIIGVRFSASDYRSGNLSWSPSASVGWARRLGDGPVVDASVVGAPGFVSIVDGATVDENQVHAGLDLEVKSLTVDGLAVTLSYAGEYGDTSASSSGKLAIRYRW